MYSTTALIVCIIIACFAGLAIGVWVGESQSSDAERASVGLLSVLVVICTIIFVLTRLIYIQ